MVEGVEMGLRLARWLRSWAPGGLVDGLSDGRGWAIAPATGSFDWMPAGSPRIDGEQAEQVWREPGGLELTLTARRVASHRAGIWQLTLRNTAGRPGPALSVLEPLVCEFPAIEKDDMTVQALGGGMTLGYYPSLSYRAYVFRPVEGDCEPMRLDGGEDGRSSNRYSPFVMTMIGDGGVVTTLDWSAEWYHRIEPGFLGPGVTVRLGVPVRNLVLEPGESLALPAVHMMFFEGSLENGTNACRRYLYDCIVPRQRGQAPVPQVGYDHWFGIRANYDEAFLRRQVDRAAELGCDYFIVDAAWYKGTIPPADFSAGVGNWEHDPAKFPHGLEPFADYVRSRGMQMGLWVEFERAHRTSDSAREHPELYWDIGSQFLHLDLRRRDAQDWAVQKVGELVHRLRLGWVRYDCNCAPHLYWQKVDPTGKVMFTHVQGLYRVLGALHRNHPEVLWETCSGGGRRLDLGILRYSHTSWPCDTNEHAHMGRYLLCGANRALPGHVLNSCVTCLTIGAGDNGMRDLNLLSRYPGTLLFSGDIASWSPGWTSRARELVEIYRSVRHLIVQDYYPLTPQPAHPDDGEAVQFVSRCGSEAIVLCYRRQRDLPPRLRLWGLDVDGEYEVSDPVGGEPIVIVSGAELLEEGIPLTVPADDARMRYLRKVR
jgi:alpha-galactosidase